MRRLLALFVLLASAALIAATPRPRPTPSLAPLSTPTPAGAPVPVVLIYPFEAPSDLDPRYGGAIAQIYAQVMTQTGGVTVLAIPTNIKREDYDKYARVQFPELLSNRTRIKATFTPSPEPLELFYPPKWGLTGPAAAVVELAAAA